MFRTTSYFLLFLGIAAADTHAQSINEQPLTVLTAQCCPVNPISWQGSSVVTVSGMDTDRMYWIQVEPFFNVSSVFVDGFPSFPISVRVDGSGDATIYVTKTNPFTGLFLIRLYADDGDGVMDTSTDAQVDWGWGVAH